MSSSCLSWFKSYLSERHQTERINSTLSDKLPVISGVPQGSILGLLLSSIYVNDPSSSINKCSSESYIDDTKLLLSFHINNSSTALVDLNGDLIQIRNWCFDNLLLNFVLVIVIVTVIVVVIVIVIVVVIVIVTVTVVMIVIVIAIVVIVCTSSVFMFKIVFFNVIIIFVKIL